MDLLFSRYASPFVLMESMLACGRFSEWVNEFMNLHNQRVEDETMFDVWLHRCFDKSYNDFRDQFAEPEPIQQADVEATINSSKGILDDFVPY